MAGMRWTTRVELQSGEWELIGGPYKTLPLAKRCARQHLQDCLDAQEPGPAQRRHPRFQIRRFVEDAERDVELESAGLQGGWRIIWEPTVAARRSLLARRLAKVAFQALKDLAAHNGDSDPFATATGIKWGLWSTETAAELVLADPGLDANGLHQSWVEAMTARGWSEATAVDVAQRTHPSLVDSQYLTTDEQMYDVVFVSTVRRSAELLEQSS
jgi:hypothetical protein